MFPIFYFFSYYPQAHLVPDPDPQHWMEQLIASFYGARTGKNSIQFGLIDIQLLLFFNWLTDNTGFYSFCWNYPWSEFGDFADGGTFKFIVHGTYYVRSACIGFLSKASRRNLYYPNSFSNWKFFKYIFYTILPRFLTILICLEPDEDEHEWGSEFYLFLSLLSFFRTWMRLRDFSILKRRTGSWWVSSWRTGTGSGRSCCSSSTLRPRRSSRRRQLIVLPPLCLSPLAIN